MEGIFLSNCTCR